MELDAKKNSFLYSVGTQLAYKIVKRYYNNTHFVWCSMNFNMLQQRIMKHFFSIIYCGQ